MMLIETKLKYKQWHEENGKPNIINFDQAPGDVSGWLAACFPGWFPSLLAAVLSGPLTDWLIVWSVDWLDGRLRGFLFCRAFVRLLVGSDTLQT